MTDKMCFLMSPFSLVLIQNVNCAAEEQHYKVTDRPAE